MLAGDALDYFERRIQRLEAICIHGNQRNSLQQPSTEIKIENILQRFQITQKQFEDIQIQIPELKIVIEKLNQLSPLLQNKKRTLTETAVKVNQLIAQKDEIQEQINSLQAIKTLTHVINQENFADADQLKQRLEKIEILVETIRPQVVLQTKEIDELIDIYEKGVCGVS